MGARGTSMPHSNNQVVDMTGGRNNFGLNVNAGKSANLHICEEKWDYKWLIKSFFSGVHYICMYF